MRSPALARVVVLLVVAWSALAFGGVYPWVYVPALVGCAGAWMLARVSRRHGLSKDERYVVIALAVTAAAVAVQLIPLDASTLRIVSPQTDEALKRIDVHYAITTSVDAGAASHALSLSAADTRRALLFLGGVTALWAAASLVMAAEGAQATARGVAAIAVVLAMIGIVQQAVTDIPYGFWRSQQGGQPFGPFVNRNHYAGWMLLALPMVIGGVCATMTRKSFWSRATWRERFLWLGSPRAGEATFFATAVGVTAAAVVLTYSKSAVAGLCWIFLVLAFLALRRRGPVLVRLVLAIGSAAALVALLAWAGLDRLDNRFSELATSRMGGRLDSWHDAWDVARRFPVTGTGVNTYSRAMLLFQQRDLAYHYSSAHNDYLQILAEGGVLVTVPAALVGAAFARTAWRRLRSARERPGEWWLRAGALLGISALGLQELVEFSMQIPAVAFLFAVLVAVATHEGTRSLRPSAVFQND
jgi:O-antigen ligase